MKKIILAAILTFIFSLNVYAADSKITVTLASCVDGDTAHFITDKGDESVRFLAIDTPEYTTTKETWGKEASELTCNKLKGASKIELEFDANSDQYDKYDRLLAWVWVDGSLLQDELIKDGLAEVAYLYGNYKYTSLLQDHQAVAEQSKIKIWSDAESQVVIGKENKTETKEEFGVYDLLLLVSFVITIFVTKYYRANPSSNTIIKYVLRIKERNLVIVRLVLYFAYVYSILPPIYDAVIVLFNKNKKNKA